MQSYYVTRLGEFVSVNTAGPMKEFEDLFRRDSCDNRAIGGFPTMVVLHAMSDQFEHKGADKRPQPSLERPHIRGFERVQH